VGVDAGLRRRHEKRVIHADDLVGIVIIELDRLIHFHTPPAMIGSAHQQAGNWRDALAETSRPPLQVVSKSGGADPTVGVNNSHLKLNS
jgi:hypothetical protein